MALTPEQKEAIILARGEKDSHGTSKTRIYRVRFLTGKGCTVLDMSGASIAQAIADIESTFGVDNIVSIE